jgi:hypothetical protein
MAKKSKVTLIKYVLKFGMGWFGAGNVLDRKFGGIKKTAKHAHAPGG